MPTTGFFRLWFPAEPATRGAGKGGRTVAEDATVTGSQPGAGVVVEAVLRADDGGSAWIGDGYIDHAATRRGGGGDRGGRVDRDVGRCRGAEVNRRGASQLQSGDGHRGAAGRS